MKLHINADVYCDENFCGKVSCVVIDPIDNELTHFVVTEQHFPLPPKDYLVSIKNVVEADEKKVFLDCSLVELFEMENYIEQEFIPSDKIIYGYGSEYLRMPAILMTQVERERIPVGELAIHHGTKVFAKNDEIGKVDDFLIKSKDDGHITHLVLREGHFWSAKKISIPVSEIEKIDDAGIHLKLAKEQIEKLPSMKIHGWFS